MPELNPKAVNKSSITRFTFPRNFRLEIEETLAV